MKRKSQLALIFLFFLTQIVSLHARGQNDTAWTKDKASKWFDSMEWFNGKDQPTKKYDAFGREVDGSEDTAATIVNRGLKAGQPINKVAFARDYHAYPQRWQKAFAYLKQTDFSNIGAGRYPIDGEDVYAVITLGPAKSMDTTEWEAHRNYDDIHYVISGKEQIGIIPLAQAKLLKAYDSSHDIAHYEAKGKYYTAETGTFFIITTEEAHRPNLKTDGSGIVKKLYVKVRRN